MSIKIISFICFLMCAINTNAQKALHNFFTTRDHDSISRLNDRINFKFVSKKNKGEKANRNSYENIKGFSQKNNFDKNLILNKSNTNHCVDTSNIFTYQKDSSTIWINNSKRLLDNNILIVGQFVDYHVNSYTSGGFAIKAKENGDILWANYYDSLGGTTSDNSVYYYESVILNDDSYILFGAVNDTETGNEFFLSTKINSNGNVIWSKALRSRIWGTSHGSSDYFYVQDAKQDNFDPNFIYINGPSWNNGRIIIKMNVQNGNVDWSNFYQPSYAGYFDNSFGIDVKQNQIISFGFFSSNYNNYIACYKLNKTTGDTISTKIFMIENANYEVAFLRANSFAKNNNNYHYFLSGTLLGSYQFPPVTHPLYHAGVVELDSNLNFLNAFSIRNSIQNNMNNTQITCHPDGSIFFTMLEFISSYSANVFQIQLQNNNILKQRKTYFSNKGIPRESNTIKINNGDLSIKIIGDSIQDIGKMEFTKLHYTDTSSNCFGENDTTLFIQPYTINNFSSRLDSVGKNVFYEVRPISLVKNIFSLGNLNYECTQTNFCDTLELIKQKDTFCAYEPIIIKTKKNNGCGSLVQFNLQIPNLASYTQINDSTHKFIFNGTWNGYIKGVIINDCKLINDSTSIVINSVQNLVNIGPVDTFKCYNSSILLNAKSGFKNYTWQDGSTDSVFIATQPGIYYVTVTSFCDNSITSDTIEVINYPYTPLSAGSDLEKCNNDTITINATTGFTNYSWLPNYNIVNINSFNPKVFPFVDTSYRVKANDSYNCTVFDTVKITVKNSPPINLGTDKYLCNGDSTVLNVPNIFDSYIWNTGNITSQLKVFSGGNYSVIGRYANGCNSYDTINIFAKDKPLVKLNSTNTICIGSPKILDAGEFKTYTWDDGSNQRLREVSTLGIYYVTVTDNFGCKGSDTAKITKFGSTPSNFLPIDSTKCNYNSIKIFPNQNYSSYLWNTNSMTKSIDVKQAGLYWLQVKDENNCIGKDTINIYNKDCLQGLYVPNAFTPNNDNVNETLKPKVFGNVEYYEFFIFDRYGKQLFYSNEINKAWDGKYNNTLQRMGTYTWICRYKLKGKLNNIEKGTFILLQ